MLRHTLNKTLPKGTRGIKHVVLTASGKDCPGMVNSISSSINRHQGNINDSRMAILGTQFSVMLTASFPDSHTFTVDELKQKNPTYAFNLVSVEDSEPNPFPRKRREFEVLCHGPDQEGILAQLTKEFGQRDINIEDLSTLLEAVPFAGYPIFQVDLILSTPSSTSLEDVQDLFKKLEEDMGMESDISEITESDSDASDDDE